MPSQLAQDSFRRLLELYVLHAIGELRNDFPSLAKADDALRCACGTDWVQFVEKQMEFAPSMPQMIRDNWQKNSQRAVELGATLSAADFATQFVAANFL